MPHLPLFLALVLVSLIAVPFGMWLILVCTDLLSLGSCISPQPGWTLFSLMASLSIMLPPALYSWPQTDLPPSQVIGETARAMLFSLALFLLAFLAFFFFALPRITLPRIMFPSFAQALAPLVCCPVLYVSYRIISGLLPRPLPVQAAPPSIRLFRRMSLLFLVMLAICPFLPDTAGVSLFWPGSGAAFLGTLWQFYALRHVLSHCGHAGFVPAWGGCCLAFLHTVFRAIPGANGMELALILCLVLLMLSTSLCLVLPQSRRWLC